MVQRCKLAATPRPLWMRSPGRVRSVDAGSAIWSEASRPMAQSYFPELSSRSLSHDKSTAPPTHCRAHRLPRAHEHAFAPARGAPRADRRARAATAPQASQAKAHHWRDPDWTRLRPRAHWRCDLIEVHGRRVVLERLRRRVWPGGGAKPLHHGINGAVEHLRHRTDRRDAGVDR